MPRIRREALGGGLAGVAEPASLLLVMENYFPGVWSYVTNTGTVQTAYPMCNREVWAAALRPGGRVDRNAAPHHGGIFSEGEVK